jgi:hypothetical protein
MCKKEESASLNATSEAMESKNHFKNAASPKSLMNRGNNNINE